MPAKINSLTKAQKERMAEWAEKWIAIGLSTERADFERFEMAARQCYRYAKLNPDVPIIRVSSPIVGAFAAPIASNIVVSIKKEKVSAVGSAVRSAVDSAVDSAVGSAVYSAVYSAVDSAVDSAVSSAVYSAVGSAVYSAVYSAVDSAVRSAVGSEVDSAVGSAVGSAARSAVGSAVYSAVYSAVRSAVGSEVDSEVDSAVRSAVGSAVYSAVGSAVYSAVYSAVDSAVDSAVSSAVGSKKLFWHQWIGGSLWPWWHSFVSFFTDVCEWTPGMEIIQRARAYRETCESACYWWPNKYFIMVCDRPMQIKKDANGRLHSEDSMAIKWPDGWGLWMWHGVRVTEKIILQPQEITRAEIMSEKNSEVSRAIAERLGWPEYMKRAETFLVDKWFDPNTSSHYELWDFKNRFELTPRLLKMESPELNDGTRPHYVEPVHPGLATCQAARRWQFAKPNGEWPEVDECNKDQKLEFEIEA